jgi:DNA-binding CsgD family transcriptional regulator
MPLRAGRMYGGAAEPVNTTKLVFTSRPIARHSMRSDARQQAADKIARLASEPKDLIAFWNECGDVIARVVAHQGAPCWYTLDPVSLLITSHYHDGLVEFPAYWLAEEYYGNDVHRLVDVVGSASGISTLHEVTGGDPTSSPRWHRNIAVGGDQELIARLRDRAGHTWGALGLYREPGRPLFDAADKQFVRAVAPHLAEGARRALLVGEATDPETPDAPGLLVLTDPRTGGCWTIDSATPGVERWLSRLPDGDWRSGRLPSAVQSVAARAVLAAEDPARPPRAALARAHTRSGSWLILHGSALGAGGRPKIAVIIEPAHPARINPLLMSAYGLTERERDVTRLVLRGNSTAEIAEALVLSTHTVQQHLKNIFAKTGVRSRRDLTAKIFYTHYEPRLRENEHRTLDSRPVRGGPKDGPPHTAAAETRRRA